jgi:hypothetical protein
MIRPTTLCLILASAGFAAEKSILFVAGPKSHGVGQHEHPEGCKLLAEHLNSSGLPVKATVSLGWPTDSAAVASADTLVIYGDGLAANPAVGHLDELRQRHQQGKGLAILHWAIEPASPEMAKLWDDLIGGHFDPAWSVNPIWKMSSPTFGKHPAAVGLASFEIEEEFYYHMRLRPDVVPLLQALPPASSLGADGPYSANPTVRKALADGIPQTLAWAVENPNKSRGFGFTGGHFHRNWANPDFRRLVLNAIVWTAGADVPATGVASTAKATPAYQTIDEAIGKGDLADVKLHLAANPASASEGRDKNRSPLAQAVLRNKTEIAVLLLDSGAKPDGVDSSQRSILHLAVDRSNATVAAALLKAKANPNLGDRDGWTPLHHAAAKNQLEIAKLLLAGGANPMLLSKLGGTPLHEAAASAGAPLVQLLLDHKVDPSIKSKEDVTALDIARKFKNQPAIDVLSKVTPGTP